MSDLVTKNEELLDCSCSDYTTGNLVYIYYRGTNKVAFYVKAECGNALYLRSEIKLHQNYDEIISIKNCIERQIFINRLLDNKNKNPKSGNLVNNNNSNIKEQIIIFQDFVEEEKKNQDNIDLKNYSTITCRYKGLYYPNTLGDIIPGLEEMKKNPLEMKFAIRSYTPPIVKKFHIYLLAGKPDICKIVDELNIMLRENYKEYLVSYTANKDYWEKILKTRHFYVYHETFTSIDDANKNKLYLDQIGIMSTIVAINEKKEPRKIYRNDGVDFSDALPVFAIYKVGEPYSMLTAYSTKELILYFDKIYKNDKVYFLLEHSNYIYNSYYE